MLVNTFKVILPVYADPYPTVPSSAAMHFFSNPFAFHQFPVLEA